jgi:hypothetical protein
MGNNTAHTHAVKFEHHGQCEATVRRPLLGGMTVVLLKLISALNEGRESKKRVASDKNGPTF